MCCFIEFSQKFNDASRPAGGGKKGKGGKGANGSKGGDRNKTRSKRQGKEPDGEG
jgi:hypothetical protein